MPHILIVDDQEQHLSSLRVLLQAHGYEVIVARSGFQALDMARCEPPELIIAALMMAGMDGFGLCREWMADSRLRTVPLIFYTPTHIDPADEALALSLGAAGMVGQPAGPDELVKLVRATLSQPAEQRLAPAADEPASQALIRELADRVARLEAENRALVLDARQRWETEEALADSEERFRLIAEHVGDIVWQLDERLCFTYVSPAVERVLGYTVEESLGIEVTSLLDPDGVSLLKRAVHARGPAAGQLSTNASVYKMKHKQGHWVGVEVISSLILGPDGQLAGFAGITRDITERLRTEKALARRALQLALLNEIGGRVTALLDLDQVLQEAATLVQERFGYHHVGLFIRDAGSDQLTIKASSGEFSHTLPVQLATTLGQGIVGWVGLHGETLLVNDVETEPRFVNLWPGCPPTRSELSVPIRMGDEIVGVLDLQSPRPNAFDPADVTTVETLADQIAVAITNARLYSQAAQRNRELSLLNRVIAATAVAAGQGIEPVLQAVCRELALAFEVPLAVAALFNQENQQAIIVAECAAESRPSVLGTIIPVLDVPAFQRLLALKTPLILEDMSTVLLPAQTLDPTRWQGAGSLLLVPLIVEDKVLGSLGVYSTEPRWFDAAQADLARRVAEQVSGVLARARLEATQQLLSAAVEQTSETVIITDTEDKILYVNPAFERISGYSRAEALGSSPHLLHSGKHDAAFYDHLWATVSAGHVWQGRFVNRTKDGRLFTEDATVTPVRNRAGKVINYVTVKRDVTRELQLEDQFRQAQKMEAVGRLAGGITHDFNNLLTVINLSSQILNRKLLQDDPLWAQVQLIEDACGRATNLTRQLLTFSRREVVEPQVVQLDQVVDGLSRMLRRLVGEDVALTVCSAQGLWSVWIDPTQVEQVVINLVVNARDALPNGGQLTVELSNVVLDAAYVARHLGVEPGEYVLLAVSDNGPGLTQEVQEHLFEPFFTTKERGKGTGLGLAIVFGIVKQNNGHIWPYSEVGLGTTFKIYLPRAAASQPATTRVVPQQPTVPLGSETLLLVEDDPLVRQMTRDILLGLGYSVLTAGDGAGALGISCAHQGPIHLLVTDVIMPHMNGCELANQLRAIRPEMRVLYTSGYADSAIVQHGVLAQGAHFVSKPFQLADLARKVRDALDDGI